MSTLLTNGLLVSFGPSIVTSEDLKISDGKIVERAKCLLPQNGDTVVNLAGKLVLPGMVCAHTHLYSVLARGMPSPSVSPAKFLEILQRVWWKLDKALDEESIYMSALVGGMEAALSGTTCLIDHHASPNAISNSISIIRDALDNVGLRGILCYEVTDRDGMERRDKGLEENKRFLAENKNPMFKGMAGAHASFTLKDESLALCAEVANEYKTGVHIHVAEDLLDEEDSRNQYRCALIDRLSKAGIISPRAILAHGINLSKEDIAKVGDLGGWLIHNPRSNMNNHVGYAKASLFGINSAIGTDGIGSNLFEEIKFAFFKAKDAGAPLSMEDCLNFLSGGHRLASLFFELPLGKLDAGSPADLIILSYEPPTPLTKENLLGHLLFGINPSHVESVMVRGDWVVTDHRLCKVDGKVIADKARRLALKLWDRMLQM